MLQREFREKQTSEEVRKRKTAAAAYMREYRVRKKNESLHSAKKRRLDDISAHEEQSDDPIPSTSARATTFTESTESNERLHHRRATAARHSRDYRTRYREARAATATETVQSSPNDDRSSDQEPFLRQPTIPTVVYDPVLQHAEAHRQFKEKFWKIILDMHVLCATGYGTRKT